MTLVDKSEFLAQQIFQRKQPQKHSEMQIYWRTSSNQVLGNHTKKCFPSIKLSFGGVFNAKSESWGSIFDKKRPILVSRDRRRVSSLAVLGESSSTPANNNGGSTARDHLAKVIGLHMQPAAAEHPLRLLQFLRF